MDDYGAFVNNYEAYTEEPGGMEYELGRKCGLNALGCVDGKRVLDFGCGPATNSKELLAMSATVIGIDISQDELKVARQRDTNSLYLHYDGIHLAQALGGQPIDGILASFSFCAVENEILKPVLRDMRQLLSKGGKLVIVEPNLEKALGARYPDLHYHAQAGVKSGDHVHVTLGAGDDAVELYHDIYRVHDDYLRLLGEAGFTNASIRQPRPWGRNIFKWWKAICVPPFLIITAQ